MAEQVKKVKSMNGTVVSDKMDKSIVVSVQKNRLDRKFKKVVKRSKRYLVHDAENKAKEGDQVTITICRPISKKKRFELSKIL